MTVLIIFSFSTINFSFSITILSKCSYICLVTKGDRIDTLDDDIGVNVFDKSDDSLSNKWKKFASVHIFVDMGKRELTQDAEELLTDLECTSKKKKHCE